MSSLASAAQIAFAVFGCAVGAGFTLGGACGLALASPAERPFAALYGAFGIFVFVLATACLVGLII